MVLLFDSIIADLCILCKKLPPLGLHHRAADFPQPHLRNIAGGNTQRIDGGWRVKGIDVREVLRQNVRRSRQRQARHQHIGHAALQRPSVCHLYIQLVQLLQHTAVPAVTQVPQVILKIIRHCIAAGRPYRVRQRVLFRQCAEGGLQRFHDPTGIGRGHGPDRNGTGNRCSVGVGDVKIVLQPSLAAGFRDNGNAGSTGVDPASKLPVPFFQLQHRRGVRALGVDQDLFVKWTFVVIARRTQKARPAFMAVGQPRQRRAV